MTESELRVLNYSGNAFSIINASTYELFKNTPVATNPDLAAISPDSRKIYVLNYGSNSLSVVNNLRQKAISRFPVGIFPLNITLIQKCRRIVTFRMIEIPHYRAVDVLIDFNQPPIGTLP
jgi:YVTN family beta-propeller protein